MWLKGQERIFRIADANMSSQSKRVEDVCNKAEVLKTHSAKGHSELSQVEGTIELSKPVPA